MLVQHHLESAYSPKECILQSLKPETPPPDDARRNVHIVVGGINTLMMGEMEVYGRRTATYSADRWEGCSRGSYRYDGVCVECPVGWTTPVILNHLEPF